MSLAAKHYKVQSWKCNNIQCSLCAVEEIPQTRPQTTGAQCCFQYNIHIFHFVRLLKLWFLLAKSKWTLLSFLYPSHKHHSIIIINSLLGETCLLNCGHHNKRRQVHRSMLILIPASHPFIILFTLFHTLNTFFFARLPNCSCLLLLSFVYFQLIIFIN